MGLLSTETNEFSAGVAQFNADYFAALDVRLQKILKQPMGSRTEAVLMLSLGGVLIDTDIVLGLGYRSNQGGSSDIIWGEEPWWVHLFRSNFGVPYVGTLEGIGIRQGLDPNRPMGIYPASSWVVPAGKIPTVYLDTNDLPGTLTRLHVLYPPPPPAPKPLPIPVSTDLVGDSLTGGFWKAGPGASKDTVKDGQLDIARNGKKVVAHVLDHSSGPMGIGGVLIYWTEI